MTGQALGRGRWRYYRCRNSYTTGPGPKCAERYVPRDLLEGSVFNEIVQVLTDPTRLRQEVQRFLGPQELSTPVRDFAKGLLRVEEQQKRLAQLFVNGELPDGILKAEAARLQSERQRLERDQVDAQRPSRDRLNRAYILEQLPAIAEYIGSWVQRAEGDDLDILLRALDIRVKACRERAVIEASVPVPVSLQNLDLVTIEQTSA